MASEKDKDKKSEKKGDKKSGLDRIFGYDEDHIDLLEKEKPWEKNPKYFQNCAISALASMKMLKHSLSGVQQGQKEGGLSLEVMGLLIGKPNGDSIVIMDAVPLPIKGEANFVEAGSQVERLQSNLLESLDERRREAFIGWYHSHPFDVTTHSNAFLSNTDVTTQTVFQSSMTLWTSIVVDPLRSLAKQKPDFGCFRTFPPAVNSSEAIAPDGSPVVDKDATIARWGPTYYRYYAMKPTFFMSSLGKQMVDVLSSNNLWIRSLSSSSVMEPEYRERFPERVKKASEQLEQGSRRYGPGMGFPAARGGKGQSNKSLEQGAKAVGEMAIELAAGQAAEVAKDLLFNEPFIEDGAKKPKKESKSS